jgi:hypothetical protein
MIRVLSVLLLFVTAATARATVLLPADFREIVNGSDIIAYGRVIDSTPQLTDDRGRVETVVTFQVGTYLKGGSDEQIVFKVPGGTVGRFRTVLVGAPAFRAGEEAVLFLTRRTGAAPAVFGLNQGVFRVRIDAQTGRRVVALPVLLARGASAETIVRGARERRPLLLERFGAEVRALMGRTPATPRGAR